MFPTSRSGGLALIIGPLLMLAVMAMHPQGSDLHADGTGHVVAVSKLVHGTALATLPIILYGLLALLRAMDDAGLSLLAFVAYAVGAMAVLIAGTANGFVFPVLLEDDPGHGVTGPTRDALLTYNWTLGQAMTQVHVVMSFVAMGLWSVHMVRTRVLARGLGIFGCLISVAALTGLFTGRVDMDVKGFGLIVLLQSLWLVAAGVLLWRGGRATT